MAKTDPLWVTVTMVLLLSVNWIHLGYVLFQSRNFVILRKIPFFEKQRFPILMFIVILMAIHSAGFNSLKYGLLFDTLNTTFQTTPTMTTQT